MNGEKIIKKAKKTPMWLIIGYIICIIAVIGTSLFIDYRKEKETPEPIDFTTGNGLGISENQYAFLNVQGLTTEVAIYGDVENEYDSSNDRYYIALSGGYMYIVDLNFDTIDLLKPWQDYIYSEEENPTVPEPVTIYGMTEEIPSGLKNLVLDYYNEGLEEENQIKSEEFEDYFGNVLLNVRKEPVDTIIEEVIILFGVMGIVVLVILQISLAVVKGKVKKYLKKNGYEEEIINQLDNNIEEKHYKDKVIITKDFLVDTQRGEFAAFKFADVKWVHIHNVKYYNVVTVSSSIIVHLRDGKTKMQCVEIKGKVSDEFMEIFNRICEKVPADCLKGFTPENEKEFKEYKKEIKRNGI